MRIELLAIVLIPAVTPYSASGAATVSQYVQGTVSGSSTVDAAGIFAPAGTDLKGKSLQLYFQYVTGDFKDIGCGAPAGSSCDLRFSKPVNAGNLASVATPQSVLISVQIDGVGRSFAPFHQGQVYVFNTPGNPGRIQVTSDFPGYALYAPAAAVQLYYTSTTKFGSPLSPNNNPVNVTTAGAGNETGVQVYTHGSDGKPVGDLITFTINGYGK